MKSFSNRIPQSEKTICKLAPTYREYRSFSFETAVQGKNSCKVNTIGADEHKMNITASAIISNREHIPWQTHAWRHTAQQEAAPATLGFGHCQKRTPVSDKIAMNDRHTESSKCHTIHVNTVLCSLVLQQLGILSKAIGPHSNSYRNDDNCDFSRDYHQLPIIPALFIFRIGIADAITLQIAQWKRTRWTRGLVSGI